VNPRWSPPTAAGKGRAHPGVVLLAVLLVLVLLVVLVWRLGGFEDRDDVLRDVAVGSPIETGPYRLRFTGATARQETDYKNTVTWKVTAIGEGLTTGTESIAPSLLGNGMFVAQDPASREVQDAETQTFRKGSASIGGTFTPGLPLQPFSVGFAFSNGYRPGATVTFVVYDLEFRDTSLLGDQDEQWTNATHASRLQLPLRVLPPATS
jgi:hypothetical protein